jgi:lactate permease
MDLLFALLPIVILILLVLVFRRTITQAVSISLLFLLFSSSYWSLGSNLIGASALKGLLFALEIIVVVFSAVLIFETLERQRLFSVISRKLNSISSDKVIQSLFILLGVVFFMEGVAGFGTPAIIAIPLLISIGYKPTQAVILSLLANSIPVSFGAVGLPVSFGIGSVVSSIEGSRADDLISLIITQIALINILGMLIMALILFVTIKKFSKPTVVNFSKYIPFIFTVVAVSSVAALIVAVFFGPELPSIIGGLTAMLTMIIYTKIRAKTFNTSADSKVLSNIEGDKNERKLLLNAFVPYGLLILLLLITRLPILGMGSFLQSITVSANGIFGSSVDYSVSPLYSAASILLFVAIFSLLWFHETSEKTYKIVVDVLRIVSRPFVALVLTLIFVQIFINSETIQLQSMPVVIAEYLSANTGSFWPLLSPVIGALGSFLSGSATVSNLIFTGIQYDVAIGASLSSSLVLALQSVGAAIGNMIAIHNIIAALAIAKLSEKTASNVIKYNLKYLAILIFVVGVVGFLAS